MALAKKAVRTHSIIIRAENGIKQKTGYVPLTTKMTSQQIAEKIRKLVESGAI